MQGIFLPLLSASRSPFTSSRTAARPSGRRHKTSPPTPTANTPCCLAPRQPQDYPTTFSRNRSSAGRAARVVVCIGDIAERHLERHRQFEWLVHRRIADEGPGGEVCVRAWDGRVHSHMAKSPLTGKLRNVSGER